VTTSSSNHPKKHELASDQCVRSTSGSAGTQRTPTSRQHERLKELQTWQEWLWEVRASMLRWDWPHIITETLTTAVCAPLAILVMVTVANNGWPVGWLVIAGMLATWAGESVTNLGFHVLSVLAARRRHHDGATDHPPDTDHSEGADVHDDRTGDDGASDDACHHTAGCAG
jgi:hypothetical protein